MGVYSVCTSTTVTIPAASARKALAALRKEIPDLGFMDGRNIEMCASLPEALEKLDFEFEIVDGDIRGLHFGGGKNDTSVFVLPILAPFIADGGKLVMEHDGEPEVWKFADGDFAHYCEEDDDEACEEVSDEAYELFELVGQFKAGVRKIAAVAEKEGNLDFRVDGESIMTAFMTAVTGGHSESKIVRQKTLVKVMKQFDRLMAHEPELDTVNRYEDSPLTLALAGGHFDLADRMIDAGATLFLDGAENPFNIAASRFSNDLLDYLADKGHAFADHADGALVLACAGRDQQDGKLEFVQHLVDELGADVNEASPSAVWTVLADLRAGATPLMAAASADDPDTVAFLLEKGADPAATDSAGNTALHYASGQTWYVNDGDRCWSAGRRNLQTVRLLSTDPAAINARNRSGQTPYTLARADNEKAFDHFRTVLGKAGAPVPVEVTDSLNGEVRCVREGQMGLILHFKNGNLDGRQEFLNKSGGTFAVVHYKDGKGDGRYQCWHDNGELMFDANLKDGNWDGELRLLARDGRLGQHLNYKDGRREGVQVLYSDDGSKIIEAHYKNGLKHGHFFFRKPDGKVLVDEEFDKGMPKKAAEDEEKTATDDPLAGLFGALLGAMTGGLLAAEMAEDKLKPTDKLFFHRQDKVLALFEKMQDRVLEEA